MDRHNETFDAMVKRLFGPDARLAGSVGTLERPGDLRDRGWPARAGTRADVRSGPAGRTAANVEGRAAGMTLF